MIHSKYYRTVIAVKKPLTKRNLIMPNTTECLCVNCHENITDPDFRVVLYQEEYPEIEIGPYCEQCLARVKICSGCQKPAMIDTVTHVGSGIHYCSECMKDLEICSHCGSQVSNTTIINGKKVCNSCIESYFFLCKSCNTYHHKNDSVSHNSLEGLERTGMFKKYGNRVCKECFERRKPFYKKYEVSTCSNCGKHFAVTDPSQTDFCQSCYNSFNTCSICGEKDPYVHTAKVEGSTMFICKSCTKKYNKCDHCSRLTEDKLHVIKGRTNTYTVCSECHSFYHICKVCGSFTGNGSCVCNTCDQTYINNICEVCGRVKDSSGNCRVCHESLIYRYSEKPPLFFNVSKKDKTKDISFGFENETTYGDSYINRKVAIKEIYKVYDPTILLCKSDASISGEGFEIVTQPMTFQYFNDTSWAGLFQDGIKKSKSCGLHVHVERSAFLSDIHLYKVCNFIYENKLFIKYIVGRGSNEYCRDFSNKVSTEIKNAKMKRTERHQAVNFNNSNTIEFRMFAGCTTEKELRYKIEFLHALITYQKVTPISTCKDLLLFKEYVRENNKTYPNLFVKVKKYALPKV